MHVIKPKVNPTFIKQYNEDYKFTKHCRVNLNQLSITQITNKSKFNQKCQVLLKILDNKDSFGNVKINKKHEVFRNLTNADMVKNRDNKQIIKTRSGRIATAFNINKPSKVLNVNKTNNKPAELKANKHKTIIVSKNKSPQKENLIISNDKAILNKNSLSNTQKINEDQNIKSIKSDNKSGTRSSPRNKVDTIKSKDILISTNKKSLKNLKIVSKTIIVSKNKSPQKENLIINNDKVILNKNNVSNKQKLKINEDQNIKSIKSGNKSRTQNKVDTIKSKDILISTNKKSLKNLKIVSKTLKKKQIETNIIERKSLRINSKPANEDKKEQIDTKISKNLNDVKSNSKNEDIIEQIENELSENVSNIAGNTKNIVNGKKVIFNNVTDSDSSDIEEINLRKRKTRNYNEISLQNETINTSNINSTRIPIYKKQLELVRDNKIKDIFEFDFAAEKKLIKENDSDCEYDKDMKEIMKVIKKKANKPKKVQKRKPNVKKVNKINVIANVEVPVKDAKFSKYLDNWRNTRLQKNKDVIECSKVVDTILIADKILPSKKLNFMASNSINEVSEIDVHACANLEKSIPNSIVQLTMPANKSPQMADISEHFEIAESNVDLDIVDQIEDDINNDFGFASDAEEYPQFKVADVNTNKIVSNLSTISFQLPNANSTMYQNANVCSPWRPNLISRRGPFKLTTNASNLPIYDQEMVINSTLLEKSLRTSKSPKQINKSEDPENTIENIPAKSIEKVIKAKKQRSILNYINPSLSIHENVNENLSCSLFDEDALSPIKNVSHSSKNQGFKRNILGEKNQNIILPQIESTPIINKQILGEKNQNNLTQIESTPIINEQIFEMIDEKIVSVNNSVEMDGVGNFFGFATPVGKCKKNIINNKPTRISLNGIQKVLRNEQKINKVIENEVDEVLKRKEVIAEHIMEEPDFPTESSQSNIKCGLFEDLQVTFTEPPRKIYRPKRTSKRRHMSVSDDEEDQPVQKIKKPKKKDVWTKAEKKQVDKWAAEFNSMCEDVEQFDLEIE